MSFAEYGLRIFFTRQIDAKLPTVGGDELLDKRSGCRLKMQDSCLDIRAWSLNQLESCRYFRELTELEPAPEKYVSKDFPMDTVEFTTEKELQFLRRELTRYKSLKLTPEQKKQLGQSDAWEAFSKDGWSLVVSLFQQFSKIKGYKEALLERAFPGSFSKIAEIHDNMKMNQLTNDRKVWMNQQQLISENNTDLNSTAKKSTLLSEKIDTDKNDMNYIDSGQSDNSSDFYINSKTTTSTTITTNEDEDDTENSTGDSQTDTISADFECDEISGSESRMVALKNNLNARNLEIEEFNNLNTNLKIMVNNRDVQIDKLKEQLAIVQSQLRDVLDQHNFEVDELKTKLSDGKNLIDQLKRKLEEQRLQCNIQMKKIDNLRNEAIDIEYLRNERNLLSRKLDEVLRNVNGTDVHKSIESWIFERKSLKERNESLEIQCAEQEEEIHHLSKLIDRIQNKNDDDCSKMQQTIEDLRTELEEKNRHIYNCEKQLVELERNSEEKYYAHETSLQQYELSDDDLDHKLGIFLKEKVDHIKEFSDHLEDAWDYIKRKEIDCQKMVNMSQKWMADNEQIFQDKIRRITEEMQYYCNKCEKYEETVKNQWNEIISLRMENEESKNEQVLNDLDQTIHEMQIKLNALHKENSNLLNENEHLNCSNNEANVEITTLKNDIEKLQHQVKSVNVQLNEKDLKIDALKSENSQLIRTLNDTKNELETMCTKSHTMKLEDEKLYSLSELQKEIAKSDKEKQQLQETIVYLRDEYDVYQKKNKRLEDNLTNTLNKNESLEIKISAIREDITNLSNDYKHNNIYSDKNLIFLPKKLDDHIKTLKKRLGLTDTNMYSDSNSINHDNTELKNYNNENINIELHASEVNDRNKYTDNNYNELKAREEIIKSLSEQNHGLKLKLNEERIMYENKLEKLRQNKMVYEDHNKIIKCLENENVSITDPFHVRFKTTRYCSLSNNNSDNDIININNERNTQNSTSTYFAHLMPSLEQNIGDFSKSTEQYNNKVVENQNIISLHNGTHSDINSKQRYAHTETVRLENLPRKEFIRNCCQRLNNKNF